MNQKLEKFVVHMQHATLHAACEPQSKPANGTPLPHQVALRANDVTATGAPR